MSVYLMVFLGAMVCGGGALVACILLPVTEPTTSSYHSTVIEKQPTYHSSQDELFMSWQMAHVQVEEASMDMSMMDSGPTMM